MRREAPPGSWSTRRTEGFHRSRRKVERGRPLAPKRGRTLDVAPPIRYTDRSLFDRCISRSVPGSMMPAIYGNSYQIVQAPGYVVIRYEMIHEARIIPLDGSPTSSIHGS